MEKPWRLQSGGRKVANAIYASRLTRRQQASPKPGAAERGAGQASGKASGSPQTGRGRSSKPLVVPSSCSKTPVLSAEQVAGTRTPVKGSRRDTGIMVHKLTAGYRNYVG